MSRENNENEPRIAPINSAGQRRENEEPGRSEEELRAVFNTITDGIAIIDLNAMMTDINPGVLKIHGYKSKDDLIGRSAFELIAPSDHEKVRNNLRICLETGCIPHIEYTFVRADGSMFPAELSTNVLRNASGNAVGFVAVIRDITERKHALDALAKAKNELEIRVSERTAELTEANASLKLEIEIRRQIEEELRKSERFNASLLENAPNPIAVSSADRTMVYVNKAMVELTGFSAKELVGAKRPFPWWPPEKYDEYEHDYIRDLSKNRNKLQRLFRKKSGELFWVEMTSSTLKDANDEIISRITIWQDISERKQAEAKIQAYQNELRLLVSQLTLAEESERHKIAILIHDGVTQLLALCGMKMEVLIDSVSGTGTAASLNEIYKILQQSIEDTRSLTFELSPPSLYDLGLDAALEEFTEQFGKDHHITAEYDDDGQPKPLDESTSVLLFQAVRELMHNVEKHAQAHRIKVYSERIDDTIQITVEDDGIGFDIKSVQKNQKRETHFGLFSIQERFRYIGGRLQIKSHPGKGSRITLIAQMKTG